MRSADARSRSPTPLADRPKPFAPNEMRSHAVALPALRGRRQQEDHERANPQPGRAPVILNSSSKNVGNVLATHPGSRITTPGERSPVIANAIAMR